MLGYTFREWLRIIALSAMMLFLLFGFTKWFTGCLSHLDNVTDVRH